MLSGCRSVSTFCLLAVVGCAQDSAAAAPAAAVRPFVRFVAAPDGGRVEALVATYRRAETTVTLFAALHVADPEFYAALQQRFDVCDALLYELVADPDVRPFPGMPGDRDDDLVTLVQLTMGRGFDLQFQDEGIDYRRGNFVHADMTPEEFDAAIEAAGSSLVGEVFAGGLPEVDREAEAKRRRFDLVRAFRSGRGAHELRLLGARLVAEPDPAQREPTVLIEGRNEKCLAVLREQLAAGRTKLGIFFGAAHMEHLERRLVEGLGFTKASEQWLTAWDCSASRFPTVEKGLKQKRYRARRDLGKLEPAVRDWCRRNPGVPPTWGRVRAAQAGSELPGRADGVDPWGRPYLLRLVGGEPEVRSLGSDGQPDTDDDVVLDDEAALSPWGAVRRATDEAKQLTARASAKTIACAVELFYVRNGRLPADLGVLAEAEGGGPYLARLEPDPWGHAYVLRGDSARDFEVKSCGRDGVEGTADDVSSRREPAPPPIRR